jgi:nucleoid-associated protein EbfC
MNMNNLMKQAQQMQAKLAMLQNELADREVEASAGGGMVKVKVNGKQQVLHISIDKECVDPNDVATLEELVLTAVNQGLKQSQDMVQEAMSKVTGGMNIPGLF